MSRDEFINAVNNKKGESLQDTISTFECYCDLVEKDYQAADAWVRHIQGDVIISKGATKLTHTFTASVA